MNECRVAAGLAAARADRAGSPVLAVLTAELKALPDAPAPADLMRPLGRHFVGERYAPDALLG